MKFKMAAIVMFWPPYWKIKAVTMNDLPENMQLLIRKPQ